jgi:hypothetical protein
MGSSKSESIVLIIALACAVAAVAAVGGSLLTSILVGAVVVAVVGTLVVRGDRRWPSGLTALISWSRSGARGMTPQAQRVVDEGDRGARARSRAAPACEGGHASDDCAGGTGAA